MEAIGLAFSALAFLDRAIFITRTVVDLGRKYQDAREDFDIVETWLTLHKAALETWMDFWELRKDRHESSEWMSRLWGPKGKETIKGHLQILEIHTKRASTLHNEYKPGLEKKRLKFRKRLRFAFSGKENFETMKDLIEVQLKTLKSDSMDIFLKMHPSFSPRDLSNNAINSLKEETLAIENVVYVQQASTAVLGALRKPCMAMELKLRHGLAGKDVFTLAASGTLKDDTIKLSLTLSVAPPVVHTVVEFDDKCREIQKEGTKEINGLTNLLSLAADEALLAPIPHIYDIGSHKLIFHGTYAGPDRGFDPDYMKVPKRPLANLFEELQSLRGNETFLRFPIRDRLDLAYLLAVTVANLYETGWLKKLCSHHVLWGKEQVGENKHCSVNVTEQVCENEIRTPFDIFRHSAVQVSSNIFSLGILLYEIGTGQLIQECGRAGPSHADSLLEQTGDIICKTYRTVVATCLMGTFDIDPKGQFLASYFSKVIYPLRELNSIRGYGNGNGNGSGQLNLP